MPTQGHFLFTCYVLFLWGNRSSTGVINTNKTLLSQEQFNTSIPSQSMTSIPFLSHSYPISIPTYIHSYTQPHMNHSPSLNPFHKLTGTGQTLQYPKFLPASPNNGNTKQHHPTNQTTLTITSISFCRPTLDPAILLNPLEAKISTANPTGCNQKNERMSQRIRLAGTIANIGLLGTKPICTTPEKKNVVPLNRAYLFQLFLRRLSLSALHTPGLEQ
jgi:hypothetical protein